MVDRTNGSGPDQAASVDPLPYLRGLTQVIQHQRLEYILTRTGRRQRRQRRLLATSVVWLVIAMALFATHAVPQVWRLLHPPADRPEPDDSAFTRARQRLGVAPLRELFRDVAGPLAAPAAPGACYRGWRLMGLDGTTFDMPDTPANARVL